MQSIKSIQFSAHGDHSVLRMESLPIPELSEYDVLIQHKAVGVNFIDTYHRSGLYSVNFPSGLGKEAAGIVQAVGKNVSDVKVGDRVAYVTAPLGAYAEAHCVKEKDVILIPDDISFETAAAMMLKGLTAAYLLLKTYNVKSGDTILVHAAAGGVSSILIPWAKQLGARVIGTVGSEAKVAVAKNNGCDEVLLYREIDVPTAVRELTEGKGVDVVYDSVGKDTFAMSLDCLKPRGLMVSFGNASGAVPDFSPLFLARKGSLFFTRPVLIDYVDDPKELQFLADALFKQVLAKNIEVKINLSLPLADAAEAHRLLESGATTGSIILLV